MTLLRLLTLASLLSLPSLKASTVVISAVPDGPRPVEPLCDSALQPLPAGVEVKIGSFPGISPDVLLDTAKTGGYAAVAAAFVPFGRPCSIGDGVDGDQGRFEIAARQPQLQAGSPLAGSEIAVLISKNNGQEFLIARFPGKVFAADTETGIEPLQTLHLSTAKLVVGSRFQGSALATSPPPATGSFANWVETFSSLTSPENLTPESDPDADGQPNFLEYVTGSDPTQSTGTPSCQIIRDESGVVWLRFRRRTGIGALDYIVETTDFPALAWQALSA